MARLGLGLAVAVAFAIFLVDSSEPPSDTAVPTSAPGDTAAPTSAPGDTAAPTSAPGDTAAPTSTPEDTAAPTSTPGDTAAPTSAPGDTAAPTSGPVDTATPTSAPGDPSAPTSAPGDTAAPTSAPGDTAEQTSPPGDTAAPTSAPGDTSAPTSAPGDTAAPTSAPGCGGALTAPPGGTVTSPNYPSNYDNDETCEWTITVAEGSVVGLTIDSFKLEDGYDNLIIYDGGSDSDTELLSLTGETSVHPFTSTSNQMFVRFTSDGSVTRQGFQFSFSDTDTVRAPPTSAPCGGILMAPPGGTVTSPNYPGNYNTYETCEWTITVPEGSVVLLTIDSFHLEEDYDYLTIYDGGSDSDTELLSLTGETSGHPFTSTSNQMFVRFTSDESETRRGFNFSYTDTDTVIAPATSAPCGGILMAPPGGTVTSPNYPGNYNTYETCEWTITVPEGSVVLLTIDSFHLEEGYDYLTIYDGGSDSDTELLSLTGETSVHPFTSTSNQMFVRFTSDESETRRGFQFSYTDTDTAIAAPTSAPGCGGVLTAPPGGTVTSPNYPDNYGNYEICEWRITVPEGRMVLLTFDSFDLEKNDDSLTIYDGGSKSDTELLSLTGKTSNHPFTSTSNEMFVRFTSDEAGTRKGFNFSYTDTDTAIGCLKGYVRFNRACYKLFLALFSEPKTYDQARQRCASDGGLLAMPRDSQTNSFIVELEDLSRYEEIWIGLTDVANEGQWVFEDGQTLESTGFSLWGPGQPRNLHDEDDCAATRLPTSTWHDEHCSTTMGFICQIGDYGLLTPYNCADLYVLGAQESGTYSVGYPRPFQVNCDMDTDGGGWTVIQRRQDGSVPFNNTWDQYVQGFGNVSGEFWLGLGRLYSLTAQQTHELYVSLEDWEGERRFAKYSEFFVGDAGSKYTATVNGYNGDATDSITSDNGRYNMNNQTFSTKDQDNDNNTNNCAAIFGQGGWWYPPGCGHAMLNGQYLTGCNPRCRHAQGIVWETWKGLGYSLKRAAMMIRPANDQWCPKPGYVRFNRVCYKYFDEGKPYDQARQTCASDGGMLAMPKDSETNGFIAGLGNLWQSRGRWIGLNDVANEGQWVFEDGQTLESTGFSNWGPRQSNFLYPGVKCVAIIRSSWRNLPCGRSAPFICQIDHGMRYITYIINKLIANSCQTDNMTDK
ncbi:uncharacterized protein LOC144866897 [Branchiostoma floridae x Branchiostoma japonicum]